MGRIAGFQEKILIKQKRYSFFGMLKRDGKVYMQVVKNYSAKESLSILRGFSDLN